jgi:uncharacterized protein
VTHFLLLYEYVPDIVERRGPHRPSHLGLVRRWKDDGRIEIAGALGDPPRGAAFAFRVAGEADVEEFVAADPYVAAGLVASRRVERWNVV